MVDIWRAAGIAAESNESGVVTQDNVSPGFIGFIIFAALGVSIFVLWKSMNKQLARIDVGDESTAQDSVDIRSVDGGGGPTSPQSAAADQSSPTSTKRSGPEDGPSHRSD